MSAKKTDLNEIKKVEKSTKTSKKETKTSRTTITKKTNSKNSTKTSAKEKIANAIKKKTATRTAATKRAKSTVSKKTNTRSSNSKSKSLLNKNLTKEFSLTEYYDLPEKYEKTVIKILAQTPSTLFVYWDISQEDREKFKNMYGENFFYNTKPVLLITNKTKNYTFEIDINDFANCWYLHVNDAKCEYNIELGRRPIANIQIPNNYVYVTSSNTIEAPNDHILFEKQQNMIYFKNVKTNRITSKPSLKLTYLRNLGKFYDIYEFYKKVYKDDFESEKKIMGNSSSVFK